MTPLEFALAYAARGWRVAPIPPGFKYPAKLPNWQQAATTDPERISRYWTANPDHGVCIATGPGSGVWALDIDPDHGGDDSLRALEAAHGELPDTVQSLTGGGGTHYLFAWPTDGREIRNNQSGLAGVGIDVRGDGGQIVVAPTVHPTTGRQYAWEIEHDPLDGVAVQPAPGWLVDLLTAAPAGGHDPARPPRRRLAADPLPGDWWEAQTSWPDELQRRGWTLHSTHHDAQGGYYELWTRPGKDIRDGASASLYWQGSDVLKVFSTAAAPLDAERTYSLFGFHVAHEYGGDFEAAARAVRATMPRSGPIGITPPTDAPKPAGRPTIVHNGRHLDDVVADAVDALHQANTPPSLFVRAGQLVRLREDEERRPIIENLRPEHCRIELATAATWWRSLKDGGMTATSPPAEIATSVLAAAHWPMPALAGVVELPVIRHDGTFHATHGYDEATRLYHWHRGAPYPHIPDAPSSADLTAAVALVDELLCDFPWDTTADRANAWALLLTPLVRPIVGQVPMALVDAPEPGTGKGLLVTVAATLSLGRPAGLMAWPSTEEELGKVITATLMAGTTMIIFDNVEGTIRSGNLAAALTADVWTGRVLGRSENTTIANRATWVATGNNIDVGGDLARRCYRIRLDARQAQPWLRTGFRHPDLADWAAGHRNELLHALCTIVRSWWTAGRPLATELPAMGGYSTWVRTVGGILHHAGIFDFLANLSDFHAQADHDANAWEAFLQAWSDELGEQPVTVAELVSRMGDHYVGQRLRDPLPEDLAGDFDRPQFTKRLGHALRRRAGRHYGADGLHLVEMPRDRRRVAIFAVTTRSVQLFDPDSAAGSARDVAQIPRGDNPATRDDALERGIAGSSQVLRGRESEESQGQLTRSDPANPASRASVRDDVLAALRADGPALNAAELASRTGRSHDAVLHALDQLYIARLTEFRDGQIHLTPHDDLEMF